MGLRQRRKDLPDNYHFLSNERIELGHDFVVI